MTNGRLYSPKRRSLSTKRWLPLDRRVAGICRRLDPAVRIGGICRRRFTVPKYLGSMVRLETKTLDVRPMKPDESALQVRGVTKRFDRLAVDALDLTVRTREFYALLGPNCARQTTTLRIVA